MELRFIFCFFYRGIHFYLSVENQGWQTPGEGCCGGWIKVFSVGDDRPTRTPRQARAASEIKCRYRHSVHTEYS